jgi:hypothetical protein
MFIVGGLILKGRFVFFFFASEEKSFFEDDLSLFAGR